LSEDLEHALKMELLQMDVKLREKQVIWETPRNIAILLAAWAAIIGTIAGVIGYKAGSAPQRPIIVYSVPAPPK